MNLATLPLVVFPALLITLGVVSFPAEANTTPELTQAQTMQATLANHPISAVETLQSDRPLLPTGCTCARCTQAAELLQGQFPL